MSKTNTMTAAQALETITSAKPAMELRIARRLEIGAVIHQGDVYMARVDDTHPKGKLLSTRQVAVGTTIGSRHVVEGDGVKVYEGKQLPAWVKEPDWVRANALLGPVVVSDKPFTLTHPEHAHHRCPAGTYQVQYQADRRTHEAVQD